MILPQPDAVSYLINIPADDPNFKAAVQRATQRELKEAILRMSGKEGNKTRVLACQREFQKRVKRRTLT